MSLHPSNLFEGTIGAHNLAASFQQYRLRRPVSTKQIKLSHLKTPRLCLFLISRRTPSVS